MSSAAELTRKSGPQRQTVESVIFKCGLPSSITSLITEISRRTRLWKRERADVALELVAHFRDGIDAGRSADELIRDFGDTKSAAKLIRRAKRRNRPWWWQVQRRATQALVVLLGLVLAANTVNMIRFYSATPTIRRDYVAEINAPILAIPAEQCAAPIYQRALAMLVDEPRMPDDPHTPVTAAADRPGQPGWQLVADYLSTKHEVLAIIRSAAAMPALGSPLTSTVDPAWIPGKPVPDPVDFEPESPMNGSALYVLLGHISPLRRMAELLRQDAYLAVEQKQPDRAVADFQAIIGIAQHNREGGLLISDLSALAVIESRVMDTLQRMLADDPALFTDAQLTNLAHQIAAYPSDGNPLVRFDAERIGWDDTIQRIYTDDGHGDGRITAEGYKYLRQVFTENNPSLAWLSSDSWIVAPTIAATIGGRAELSRKYREMMDQIETMAHTPLWQRGPDRVDAEVSVIVSDTFQRTKYLPIAILMPALGRMSIKSEQFMQHRNAVLVMIAVELFKRRTGEYPASISELVPSLLPAVPLDRFDGQPLRYARTSDGRYTIYSVGSDLDDDGGRRTNAVTGDAQRTFSWLGREQVEAARKTGDSRGIPEGDWVLFPPEK